MGNGSCFSSGGSMETDESLFSELTYFSDMKGNCGMVTNTSGKSGKAGENQNRVGV